MVLPLQKPTVPVKAICVYAGSTFGAHSDYSTAATAFGRACARRGLAIVYGGGSVGLMGLLANAALAEGGKVTGVIPRKMLDEERGHHGVTELLAVDTMHQRKHRMAQLADAFVALPGGIGTLEELTEMFTWLQLGLHMKPVGLLNVRGYYDPLLALLAHMRDEQFLLPAHHDMLTVADEPETLLDRLLAVRHRPVHKPIQPVTLP